MGEEIERKFLVREIYDFLLRNPKREIIQGYLPNSGLNSEERIRYDGEVYTRTEKSSGTLVREENEIEISQKEFSILWTNTKGARIEKTRYFVPYNGK